MCVLVMRHMLVAGVTANQQLKSDGGYAVKENR